MAQASASLTNAYVLRTATSERPCFVCNKFSNAVLTTEDNRDWFYTCRKHLEDVNFCVAMGGVKPGNGADTGSPRSGQSTPDASKKKAYDDSAQAESNSVTDLVSTIGSGLWNAFRGSKEDDKKDKDKDEKKESLEASKETKSGSTSPQPRPSTPSTPSSPSKPKKYVLNRNIYYLRNREYQRKVARKQQEERLQNLSFPKVPTTIPGTQNTDASAKP